MRVTRSKWGVPLLSVALGLVVLAAQWIGGDPGSGLVSLAIMTGFGALILSRSWASHFTGPFRIAQFLPRKRLAR